MPDEIDISAALNTYSAAFDKLCQERHEAGAAEYGEITFLGNDVIRMMMEELADTSNYCRMQFIKLMILGEAVAEVVNEKGIGDGNEVNVTLGVENFKGAGKIGWNR